jgi:V8-like Glu-specific endopeptidase
MHRALVATAGLLAATVTALVTTVGLAAPGHAIIGGQPDTTHDNVGVLLPPTASPVARWCGVTPVSPTVVVLAGHCAVLRKANFGQTDGDITFDPRFIDSLGDQQSGWAYTGSYPTYHGTLVAHPMYDPHGSGYDVAVMVLDEPISGIDVEELPAAGLLDDLKAAGTLKDQPMTLVGFGTTTRLPGNAFVGGGYRQVATQTVQSLGAAIVKHKGEDGSSVCINDSGSPLFVGDQLVGVLSAGNGSCSNLSISARLDAPEVRSWLAEQIAMAG